jgi:hypothetical protein
MPVFYDILVSVRRTLSNQIKVDLAKLFSIFLVNVGAGKAFLTQDLETSDVDAHR